MLCCVICDAVLCVICDAVMLCCVMQGEGAGRYRRQWGSSGCRLVSEGGEGG